MNGTGWMGMGARPPPSFTHHRTGKHHQEERVTTHVGGFLGLSPLDDGVSSSSVKAKDGMFDHGHVSPTADKGK